MSSIASRSPPGTDPLPSASPAAGQVVAHQQHDAVDPIEALVRSPVAGGAPLSILASAHGGDVAAPNTPPPRIRMPPALDREILDSSDGAGGRHSPTPSAASARARPGQTGKDFMPDSLRRRIDRRVSFVVESPRQMQMLSSGQTNAPTPTHPLNSVLVERGSGNKAVTAISSTSTLLTGGESSTIHGVACGVPATGSPAPGASTSTPNLNVFAAGVATNGSGGGTSAATGSPPATSLQLSPMVVYPGSSSPPPQRMEARGSSAMLKRRRDRGSRDREQERIGHTLSQMNAKAAHAAAAAHGSPLKSFAAAGPKHEGLRSREDRLDMLPSGHSEVSTDEMQQRQAPGQENQEQDGLGLGATAGGGGANGSSGGPSDEPANEHAVDALLQQNKVVAASLLRGFGAKRVRKPRSLTIETGGSPATPKPPLALAKVDLDLVAGAGAQGGDPLAKNRRRPALLSPAAFAFSAQQGPAVETRTASREKAREEAAYFGYHSAAQAVAQPQGQQGQPPGPRPGSPGNGTPLIPLYPNKHQDVAVGQLHQVAPARLRRGSSLTSFTLGTSLKAHATRLSNTPGKRRQVPATSPIQQARIAPGVVDAFRSAAGRTAMNASRPSSPPRHAQQQQTLMRSIPGDRSATTGGHGRAPAEQVSYQRPPQKDAADAAATAVGEGSLQTVALAYQAQQSHRSTSVASSPTGSFRNMERELEVARKMVEPEAPRQGARGSPAVIPLAVPHTPGAGEIGFQLQERSPNADSSMDSHSAESPVLRSAAELQMAVQQQHFSPSTPTPRRPLLHAEGGSFPPEVAAGTLSSKGASSKTATEIMLHEEEVPGPDVEEHAGSRGREADEIESLERFQEDIAAGAPRAPTIDFLGRQTSPSSSSHGGRKPKHDVFGSRTNEETLQESQPISPRVDDHDSLTQSAVERNLFVTEQVANIVTSAVDLDGSTATGIIVDVLDVAQSQSGCQSPAALAAVAASANASKPVSKDTTTIKSGTGVGATGGHLADIPEILIGREAVGVASKDIAGAEFRLEVTPGAADVDEIEELEFSAAGSEGNGAACWGEDLTAAARSASELFSHDSGDSKRSVEVRSSPRAVVSEASASCAAPAVAVAVNKTTPSGAFEGRPAVAAGAHAPAAVAAATSSSGPTVRRPADRAYYPHARTGPFTHKGSLSSSPDSGRRAPAQSSTASTPKSSARGLSTSARGGVMRLQLGGAQQARYNYAHHQIMQQRSGPAQRRLDEQPAATAPPASAAAASAGGATWPRANSKEDSKKNAPGTIQEQEFFTLEQAPAGQRSARAEYELYRGGGGAGPQHIRASSSSTTPASLVVPGGGGRARTPDASSAALDVDNSPTVSRIRHLLPAGAAGFQDFRNKTSSPRPPTTTPLAAATGLPADKKSSSGAPQPHPFTKTSSAPIGGAVRVEPVQHEFSGGSSAQQMIATGSTSSPVAAEQQQGYQGPPLAPPGGQHHLLQPAAYGSYVPPPSTIANAVAPCATAPPQNVHRGPPRRQHSGPIPEHSAAGPAPASGVSPLSTLMKSAPAHARMSPIQSPDPPTRGGGQPRVPPLQLGSRDSRRGARVASLKQTAGLSDAKAPAKRGFWREITAANLMYNNRPPAGAADSNYKSFGGGAAGANVVAAAAAGGPSRDRDQHTSTPGVVAAAQHQGRSGSGGPGAASRARGGSAAEGDRAKHTASPYHSPSDVRSSSPVSRESSTSPRSGSGRARSRRGASSTFSRYERENGRSSSSNVQMSASSSGRGRAASTSSRDRGDPQSGGDQMLPPQSGVDWGGLTSWARGGDSASLLGLTQTQASAFGAAQQAGAVELRERSSGSPSPSTGRSQASRPRSADAAGAPLLPDSVLSDMLQKELEAQQAAGGQFADSTTLVNLLRSVREARQSSGRGQGGVPQQGSTSESDMSLSWRLKGLKATNSGNVVLQEDVDVRGEPGLQQQGRASRPGSRSTDDRKRRDRSARSSGGGVREMMKMNLNRGEQDERSGSYSSASSSSSSSASSTSSSSSSDQQGADRQRRTGLVSSRSRSPRPVSEPDRDALSLTQQTRAAPSHSTAAVFASDAMRGGGRGPAISAPAHQGRWDSSAREKSRESDRGSRGQQKGDAPFTDGAAAQMNTGSVFPATGSPMPGRGDSTGIVEHSLPVVISPSGRSPADSTGRFSSGHADLSGENNGPSSSTSGLGVSGRGGMEDSDGRGRGPADLESQQNVPSAGAGESGRELPTPSRVRGLQEQVNGLSGSRHSEDCYDEFFLDGTTGSTTTSDDLDRSPIPLRRFPFVARFFSVPRSVSLCYFATSVLVVTLLLVLSMHEVLPGVLFVGGFVAVLGVSVAAGTVASILSTPSALAGITLARLEKSAANRKLVAALSSWHVWQAELGGACGVGILCTVLLIVTYALRESATENWSKAQTYRGLAGAAHLSVYVWLLFSLVLLGLGVALLAVLARVQHANAVEAGRNQQRRAPQEEPAPADPRGASQSTSVVPPPPGPPQSSPRSAGRGFSILERNRRPGMERAAGGAAANGGGAFVDPSGIVLLDAEQAEPMMEDIEHERVPGANDPAMLTPSFERRVQNSARRVLSTAEHETADVGVTLTPLRLSFDAAQHSAVERSAGAGSGSPPMTIVAGSGGVRKSRLAQQLDSVALLHSQNNDNQMQGPSSRSQIDPRAGTVQSQLLAPHSNNFEGRHRAANYLLSRIENNENGGVSDLQRGTATVGTVATAEVNLNTDGNLGLLDASWRSDSLPLRVVEIPISGRRQAAAPMASAPSVAVSSRSELPLGSGGGTPQRHSFSAGNGTQFESTRGVALAAAGASSTQQYAGSTSASGGFAAEEARSPTSALSRNPVPVADQVGERRSGRRRNLSPVGVDVAAAEIARLRAAAAASGRNAASTAPGVLGATAAADARPRGGAGVGGPSFPSEDPEAAVVEGAPSAAAPPAGDVVLVQLRDGVESAKAVQTLVSAKFPTIIASLLLAVTTTNLLVLALVLSEEFQQKGASTPQWRFFLLFFVYVVWATLFGLLYRLLRDLQGLDANLQRSNYWPAQRRRQNSDAKSEGLGAGEGMEMVTVLGYKVDEKSFKRFLLPPLLTLLVAVIATMAAS